MADEKIPGLTAVVILILLCIIGFMYFNRLTPERVLVSNFVTIRGGWIDTGIDFDGSKLITASGQVTGYRCGESSGPDGIPDPDYSQNFWKVGNDIQFLGLMAQFNRDHHDIFIGQKAVIRGSGRLFLAINREGEDRRVDYNILPGPSTTYPGDNLTNDCDGGYSFFIQDVSPTFQSAFVYANQSWQNTGIKVNGSSELTAVGQTITKTTRAMPLIRNDGDYERVRQEEKRREIEKDLRRVVAPAGWRYNYLPEIVELSDRYAPNCPFMSLVVRLDAGAARCMGTNQRLDGRGTVWAVVNDIFRDRTGKMRPDWQSENEGGYFIRAEAR